MPGFMGLRGLENKTAHDMEKERREEHQRDGGQHDLERRSREKVQEILRDQEGDMSAYTGHPPHQQGACDDVSRFPIERIMSGRVAVLSFDDTLLTVHGIFNSVKFRHLPVVDDEGNIIGIVSDRDFLRMTSPFFGTVNEQKRDVELMNRKVGMGMSRNPVCISTDVTVIDAVKIMNRKRISCLPVVEKGTLKLLGIVTWKDIVRAFIPDGFNRSGDSQRLRTGVHLNPESTESARIRAKAAESARLQALAREAPSPEMPPEPRQDAPRRGSPGPGRPQPRRQASDTEALPAAPSGDKSDRISLSSEPKILASRTLSDSQRMKPPTEQKL